ncbi:MAG: hypothetical protein COY81_04715 [Candidatus Pacebacteria bacterium CG_4_10_14_0_8_um_filter_43_12]|nr:MAG: hypothetical protein COY81_04715 [Candidatus Pacebacteria bacterium CG_4_10_14_0_8_um_filter_43_12]
MLNLLKQILTSSSTKYILFLYILTVTIRIAGTDEGNFPYWFDLGRDAILSREILENGDLKIQGPSASGTNDTVFHGVLYYYLIGPLYTLFAGDPRTVMIGLVVFSSLAVIPVFILTKELTGKKAVAIVAGILYAFSLETYRSGTWMSNPILAAVSLPTFFLFYWLVFFKSQRKLLPLLFLCLGITHQSVVLFVPWWGLVATGFWLEHTYNLKSWSSKLIATSFVAYFVTIASMILVQTRMMIAGLFSLNSVFEYAS